MGGCVNKEERPRARQQQVQQPNPQQYQHQAHLVTYDAGGRQITVQHVGANNANGAGGSQYVHPWPQGQRMLHFFNQHLLAAAYAGRSQQQQPSDVPELTEARNLRNYANIQKESLKLTRVSASSFRITFKLDCLVPTCISIFAACQEEGLKEGHITFKSLQRSSQLQPLRPVNVEAGNDVVYAPDDVINFGKYNIEQCSKESGKWPLVIQLEYTTPPVESGEGIPEEEVSPGGSKQLFYSYLSVDVEKGTALVETQKLQLDKEVFEVEDIFGAAIDEAQGVASDTPPDDGTLGEDDVCVICLTEAKDTLVMPCRHRCLCQGCASDLRNQTNKCPMCRTPIEGLLKGPTSSLAISPRPNG